MAAELNRIEKRAIEAMAIAPLVKAFAEKIGLKQSLGILCRVNEQEAYERGQQVAASGAPNDIAAMVDEVATWGTGGTWEMDVLEQSDTKYFFNVTRCPYYDMYRELGLLELGVCLSCCRDEPYARGFNPNLKLVRTKTIMEGYGHCDFRYYLKEDR